MTASDEVQKLCAEAEALRFKAASLRELSVLRVLEIRKAIRDRRALLKTLFPAETDTPHTPKMRAP